MDFGSHRHSPYLRRRRRHRRVPATATPAAATLRRRRRGRRTTSCPGSSNRGCSTRGPCSAARSRCTRCCREELPTYCRPERLLVDARCGVARAERSEAALRPTPRRVGRAALAGTGRRGPDRAARLRVALGAPAGSGAARRGRARARVPARLVPRHAVRRRPCAPCCAATLRVLVVHALAVAGVVLPARRGCRSGCCGWR